MKKFVLSAFMLLVAVAMASAPAYGVIAHVQTDKTNDSSATTHSIAYTSANTAGNLLFAGICFSTNTTTATIADTAGNTWLLVSGPDNQTLVGNLFRCYTWYVKSAIGSTNTVTVTLSVAQWSVMQVSEFSGLDTVAPLDQVTRTATATKNTSPNSGNVTTTQANEVLIGFGGDLWINAGTITAGTGYTLPTNGNNDSAGNGQYTLLEYQIVSATGTYSATATLGNSSGWLMYIVTFKGAGGGGGGGAPHQLPTMGCCERRDDSRARPCFLATRTLPRSAEN